MLVRPFSTVLALALLVLGACAGPQDDPEVGLAGLEGRVATLRFTADWRSEVEGSLVAGGIARIAYAPERATCTTSRYGSPAWSVVAHYRIAGGEVRTLHAAGHAPAPDQIDVPIELTGAGELEVWFENTDVSGCHAWDSAFGANYRFVIAPAPSDAAVRFDLGAEMVVEGELGAGRTLEIDYDPNRLTACRDTRYGLPAWNVRAHYRYPSGRTGELTLYIGNEAQPSTIVLAEAGELELWFENQGYYGCRAWDSLDGENYRVVVDADPRAPGWMGNAAYVIDRMTCDGGPCDASRRSLDDVFTYGTYARQRAAIRAIYFDVWKAGVTDRDNPDLWQQLDVQVHLRARTGAPFATRYVRFFRRVGNDARYELALAEIDPLAGPSTRTDVSECPDADLSVDGSGAYVQATVEYYFTVNGVPLRRTDGANFRGVFEDYRSAFEICLAP